MREAKASHSRDELRALSRSLCSAIKSDVAWDGSDIVLLYYPLADEVDVTSLMAEGRAGGKTVLLPAVVGDDLELRVYDGDESLRTGAFGIKEPLGREYTDYDSIGLVLVPGLAFDKEGHRLGRGRGYYDRLLPRLSHARRVGVCFPFQIVESVPIEAHDQRVDEVVSTD